MAIYEQRFITVIGGTSVIVQLEEVANWDGPPNTELTTRFVYSVEGERHEWGYAIVLSDFLEWEYMLQEFRQEVARWARLASNEQ
jgi:hypothetical protein